MRYAPSPTGFLHLGGLRTALFNALLALRHGGQFILRIEDTDRTRLVEGAAKSFEEDLRWLGIPVDEGPLTGGRHGPYTQSERGEIYREHVEQLHQCGHVYRCFCSAQTLEDLRQRQSRSASRGSQSFYDRRCSFLTLEQVRSKLEAGVPHTYRLRVPAGVTAVQDALRGTMEFPNAAVDDQILLKSDGMPTYHLASVVDDHLMGISHVIRGEEWVMSSPKHQLLYRAFGWAPPQFVHLPLLLNAADRSKLSKRQADASVSSYRERGFLPPAILNFVAFLGWSPLQRGDLSQQDHFLSLSEMASRFSLADLHRSPAVVDMAKLRWFNAHYLRESAAADSLALLPSLRRLISDAFPATRSDTSDQTLISLLKLAVLDGRIALLSEVPAHFAYLFASPQLPSVDGLASSVSPPLSAGQVAAAISHFAQHRDQDLLASVKPLVSSLGITRKQAYNLLRLLLTDTEGGPPLAEILSLFSHDELVRRLDISKR